MAKTYLFTETQFEKLCTMQDKLNTTTCGKDWMTSNVCTKTNKLMSFDEALLDECSELLNCYDWKHWKKGPIDRENMAIELVDILHFILSLNMRLEKRSDFNQPVMDSEVFFNPSMFIVYSHNVDFSKLYGLLSKFMEKLNITSSQMYSRYMVKNMLNKLRQNYGYNTGDYIKEWDGIEDNKYLLDYDFDNLEPDEIYKKIESIYNVKVLKTKGVNDA